MAKSTLDDALAELDLAETTVLDIIAKAGARAPDHAAHADISTIEIAVADLRVALRNRT